MTKYRRIEVNAFRRRVTVVSGEWPRDIANAQPAQSNDAVSLNDTDLCEPVATDSPEGQLILIEAMRSLERRLSLEARASIRDSLNASAPNQSCRKGLHLKWQSFYQAIRPTALRFAGRRIENVSPPFAEPHQRLAPPGTQSES